MPRIISAREAAGTPTYRAVLPKPVDTDQRRSALCVDSADHFVRRLFDVGLQLHALREVFEGDDVAPERVHAANDAVVEILDGLDKLIRTTGLTMLAVAGDRSTVTENGHQPPTGIKHPVFRSGQHG